MARARDFARRFVAQEWSHEGTLQAMVDKAEKDLGPAGEDLVTLFKTKSWYIL